MKKEHCFGFILFFKNNDGIREYLIIDQKSYNDSFWGLPKGHPENNETPLETAKRECFEEVGISNIKILPGISFNTSYEFPLGGETIQKTVTFFVGEVSDKTVHIETTELNGYKRANIENIKKIIIHKNYLDILISAENILNEKKI